jgi:hypothetical protein
MTSVRDPDRVGPWVASTGGRIVSVGCRFKRVTAWRRPLAAAGVGSDPRACLVLREHRATAPNVPVGRPEVFHSRLGLTRRSPAHLPIGPPAVDSRGLFDAFRRNGSSLISPRRWGRTSCQRLQPSHLRVHLCPPPLPNPMPSRLGEREAGDGAAPVCPFRRSVRAQTQRDWARRLERPHPADARARSKRNPRLQVATRAWSRSGLNSLRGLRHRVMDATSNCCLANVAAALATLFPPCRAARK